MLEKLTDAGIAMIKKAAKLLTGSKKRQYIAEVAVAFLDGNARKTAVYVNDFETPIAKKLV